MKPLEDMNQVTQQIARLNFQEYVRVDSEDELGTLAASINSMSDQLRENMEELQKELEFRKGMVRNLAHELKTPIAVIGGYAEYAAHIAENQPQKLPRYLEVISRESGRMNDMVQTFWICATTKIAGRVFSCRLFQRKSFFGNCRRKQGKSCPGKFRWKTGLREMCREITSCFTGQSTISEKRCISRAERQHDPAESLENGGRSGLFCL